VAGNGNLLKKVAFIFVDPLHCLFSWLMMHTCPSKSQGVFQGNKMTDFTYDQAVERFNEDMSNSICDGDRKNSTQWLAERISDTECAERLRRDWMIQFRQTLRELV
jgi:hypothetical protein